MDQTTINEGKIMAMVSYLTVVGLLIAYLVNNGNKNEFVKFHIGQSVRVVILYFALGLVLGLTNTLMGLSFLNILRYAPLVFIILGMVNAYQGKVEKLPIIGTIGE